MAERLTRDVNLEIAADRHLRTGFGWSGRILHIWRAGRRCAPLCGADALLQERRAGKVGDSLCSKCVAVWRMGNLRLDNGGKK